MLNDSYGFSFGDKTLVEFTKILQQNFEHSTLYRLEGDLFSILLHEVKENVLGRIAQLNAFLAHHTLHIDNIEIRLNITIGVVIDEESNLIQKADIASRQARTISRNRTQLYDKELSIIKKMQNNTQWSKIILQAIESDNLLAYFQPIVENSTGKIVKYETLVRLKHHSTIHTPFDFLQTARYAGLLTHITRRMLDKACSQFSNTDYIFSVNITDHDLQDPELIPYVTRLLKKYHIKPKQLIFELLEQSSIAQIPNATAQLKALHQLGCPISIDDFGVECSNFAQLFSYDLESIKIDGSFIKNIHESHDCQLIVESILFFAKRAGIKTVAEYVHSKEVYEKVLALGIDYSQGYYFGKPQPTLL
jgi:EAL domain-containing protein (putative c-di-GMP-specific phosphodiesterase class I)